MSEPNLLQRIEAKVRALHHYGNPPDAPLQEDVDSDVRDILEDVATYAVELATRVPRRVPPEPSEAAIEAALAKIDFGRPVSPMHLDSMEDSVVEALRAAYAAEAPPPVVTVAHLGELLYERFNALGKKIDATEAEMRAASMGDAVWLHAKLFPGAHLVPPEAP